MACRSACANRLNGEDRSKNNDKSRAGRTLRTSQWPKVVKTPHGLRLGDLIHLVSNRFILSSCDDAFFLAQSRQQIAALIFLRSAQNLDCLHFGLTISCGGLDSAVGRSRDSPTSWFHRAGLGYVSVETSTPISSSRKVTHDKPPPLHSRSLYEWTSANSSRSLEQSWPGPCCHDFSPMSGNRRGEKTGTDRVFTQIGRAHV